MRMLNNSASRASFLCSCLARVGGSLATNIFWQQPQDLVTIIRVQAAQSLEKSESTPPQSGPT